PELRELDVALFEDELALFVGDECRAQLPVDLVERLDAILGEVPFEFESGYLAAGTKRPRGGLRRRLRLLRSLHACPHVEKFRTQRRTLPTNGRRPGCRCFCGRRNRTDRPTNWKIGGDQSQAIRWEGPPSTVALPANEYALRLLRCQA